MERTCPGEPTEWRIFVAIPDHSNLSEMSYTTIDKYTDKYDR